MKTKLLYFSGYFFRKLYIIICTISLLLGGLIYISFRTKEPIFINWGRSVGLGNLLNFFRFKFHGFRIYFPEWVIFSLPNFLWAFAYALLITHIWSGSKSWLRYIWMASIPILVLGFEILQYSNIIQGTFCFQDLTFGMVGLIIGITLGITTTKSNNHEKAFY